SFGGCGNSRPRVQSFTALRLISGNQPSSFRAHFPLNRYKPGLDKILLPHFIGMDFFASTFSWSTITSRHLRSWPWMSILTGQTALHDPHREEANGRSSYSSKLRAGAMMLPIGPGTE